MAFRYFIHHWQSIAQWAIRKIIRVNTQLCRIKWTSLSAAWRLSLILIYWTEATINCRHQISQGQYQYLAIRLSSSLKSDIPDTTVTNEKHNSRGDIFKCELKYLFLTWWKPLIPSKLVMCAGFLLFIIFLASHWFPAKKLLYDKESERNFQRQLFNLLPHYHSYSINVTEHQQSRARFPKQQSLGVSSPTVIQSSGEMHIRLMQSFVIRSLVSLISLIHHMFM